MSARRRCTERRSVDLREVRRQPGRDSDPLAEVADVVERAATRGPLGPGDVRVLPPAAILRLQRRAGNRGVVGLLEGSRRREMGAARRRPTAVRARRGVVQRSFVDDLRDAASRAVGAVSSAARSAWDRAESGVRAAGSTAREIASRLGSVASGVARSAADAATGAWSIVTRTAATAGRQIAEGARTAWDATTEVAGDVVEGIAETGGRAWEQLAGMARRAASGASEIAANLWSALADSAERVWSSATDLARSAWDTARDTASGAWRAARATASNVAAGVRNLAASAWGGIRSAAGAAWDEVSGEIGSLWSSVTEGVGRALKGIAERAPVPGSDVRSRPLTSRERAYAQRIFGDTLDYDAIVITRGSVMATGSARATANAINLEPRDFVGDTMELSGPGYGVLIHEMTHVFQYQHGGLGYIPESLWEQWRAWETTGDRNAAYDWRPLAAAGVPWESWNVEQQATAVQDYNLQLSRMEADQPYDAEELARLQPYVEHMRSGPRRPARRSTTAA